MPAKKTNNKEEIKIGRKTTGINVLAQIQGSKAEEIQVMYGAKYTRLVDEVIYQLLRSGKHSLTVIPEIKMYKDKEGNEREGRRKDLFIKPKA